MPHHFGLGYNTYVTIIFTLVVIFASGVLIEYWLPFTQQFYPATEIDYEQSCEEMSLGNKQILAEPFHERLFYSFFLYSLRFLMWFGCRQYLRGNKYLHWISENIFYGHFTEFYGTFQFIMAYMSPQLCNNATDFYTSFHQERIGHLLYEMHDIYSMMMQDPMLFKLHPTYYWGLQIQFYGGIWESLAHELTVYGWTRSASMARDTHHPGMWRGLLNIYVIFAWGLRSSIAFIYHTGPAQWHYAARMVNGSGATMAGYFGVFRYGYRSEFYGPPNMNLQLMCDAQLATTIKKTGNVLARRVLDIQKFIDAGQMMFFK